jgi:hypothetical protein
MAPLIAKETIDETGACEVLHSVDVELHPCVCVKPINKYALHTLIILNDNGLFGHRVDRQRICSLELANSSIERKGK